MKTKTFTLAMALISQFIFAQITGFWKGDLVDLEGKKLPLVFNIISEGAGYKTVLYIPTQASQGVPTDETTFRNENVSVKMGLIEASFNGKIQNDKIAGTFTQDGHATPLALNKISKEEFDAMMAANAPKKSIRKEIPPIGNREIDTKKLDAYLNYIAENHQGMGSVSIFRHGKEIYRKDYGQEQISGKYYKNTAYQIGSISKLFTAVMLMQQVEKGKLKLTDKLSKFYPDMPNADKITIESMMNHTSGLGNYNDNSGKWLIEKSVGNNAILDRIKKDGVTFQPGERTEYSNSAFYLLSRILEKVGGKPYNVLLKENILKKAGMKNTFSALDQPKNTFKGYEFKDNSWQPIQDYDFTNIVGLGDMSSTTTDLNIFINALFQNKFLKKETLKQMMPTTSEFGLTMMLLPFYNMKHYGHGGDTKGQHSSVGYNLEDDLSIAQTINGTRMGRNDFMAGLLSIIYNLDYELPKF